MAYPKFSKPGFTDLVFSKGDLFPRHSTKVFNQLRGVSQGRTVRVATLAPPDQYHYLHFEQLSIIDYDALNSWLTNVARGAAETFTYTDTAGVASTVRWWDDRHELPTFDMPLQKNTLYAVDITLRVEV